MVINVALNKPTTASTYVKPFSASKAVDGVNMAKNRWLCSALPGYMVVDLGMPYSIDRWVVKQMGGVGWPDEYNIQDYRFQGSNSPASNQWTDLDFVVGNKLAITDRKLTSIATFRYFRVAITKGFLRNIKMGSIVELEIYTADSVATLSNLAILNGVLAPNFDSNTFNYSSLVNFDQTSVKVIPTATDSKASILVNGVAVVSGMPSQDIALGNGVTNIAIEVTSSDQKMKKTYTLAVSKADNPLLSNLVLSAGTLSPNFDSKTYNYSTAVDYVTSQVTVTPTAISQTAKIYVNEVLVSSGTPSSPITLPVGLTPIKIEVKPATGASKIYMVMVTRPNSVYLSKVVVNYTGSKLQPGSVTINCDHTNTNLSAVVNTRATQVTVTPTAEDPAVTIKVNNVVVPSGGTSGQFSLGATPTVITIDVSGYSMQRSYQLTVSKG